MAYPEKGPLIGVAGNCVSGKTTLVDGLRRLGYKAVNIPQEHSTAAKFWRRFQVDFLVVLSCNLESAKARRRIPWGEERLRQQVKKLADARAHCQLYLPTDERTINEVKQIVVAAVERWKEG